MKDIIYIRGLRQVTHTVFSVNDGQKYFIDPQFGRRCPYSSGQQVKRSIFGALNMPESPVTFNWNINLKDDKAEQKEPHSSCDPRYADQLLGGYMRIGGDDVPLKRRSPLSISAMIPLHPLLGGIEYPHENLSFDRSGNSEAHTVNVYCGDKKERVKMSEEELEDWLTKKKRTLPARSFIQDQTRAIGLFTYDIAIDLRRLFSVSTSLLEPEISAETQTELIQEGWVKSENAFGKCLVAPKELREEILKELPRALIEWMITSNQSRTFSLQPTLAVALSNNANDLANVFSAELVFDDKNRPTATPIIEGNSRTNIYLTPLVAGIIPGIKGDKDALIKAEEDLYNLLKSYNFEK